MAIAIAPSGQCGVTDEGVAPAAAAHCVLFVEASSGGGIVGGSLTGLLHQMYGMGPDWRCALALYEPKAIEAELAARGIAVHQVPRWRVPKQHALQQSDAYHSARRLGAVRAGLQLGRLVLRTAAEEVPAALALARIIRREGADVVHLGNGVRANFDGILACWLTRTPCVCHVKGFEKYGGRERWAARHLDAIVCMTEAVAAHCERAGVRAPVMPVIYDALDAEDFQPRRPRAAVRAELGLGPDACALGIIGNIQEWKGQGIVVDAVAAARQTAPDLRCVIVGGVHRAGRDYAEQLRQRVCALGLEEAVRFLGFRSDVPDIVNALDIVVHASTRPEPFGRVILESMLLGCPVIAAAAGGVPEFVRDGETGFLVPPGDPMALAARIGVLARDPALRQRLGAAAQREARERFSLAHHVASMTALYKSIMKDTNA